MSILTQIDIHEAESRFTELISLELAGNEIIVTDEQKPVVRLIPVEKTDTERIAGLHAGEVWISEDFDEPLPDGFWAGS